MKRVVPIWMFILILVPWQKPAVPVGDNVQENRSIIQEPSPIHHPRYLVWTEATNNDDPQEIPAVVASFQHEEPLFMGTVALVHFTLRTNDLANPLLIDRPPPTPVA